MENKDIERITDLGRQVYRSHLEIGLIKDFLDTANALDTPSKNYVIGQSDYWELLNIIYTDLDDIAYELLNAKE